MKSLISLAAVLVCSFQILGADADLIDTECRTTPNPSLCSSSLRPFYKTHKPPSVRELAIVLGSEVLVNKLYDTFNAIDMLIKEGTGSYAALIRCAARFQQMRNVNIKQFRESFTKPDYGAAVQALRGIVPLANQCSDGLSISSIRSMCSDVSGLANVAASLVRASAIRT